MQFLVNLFFEACQNLQAMCFSAYAVLCCDVLCNGATVGSESLWGVQVVYRVPPVQQQQTTHASADGTVQVPTVCPLLSHIWHTHSWYPVRQHMACCQAGFGSQHAECIHMPATLATELEFGNAAFHTVGNPAAVLLQML